MLQSPLISKLKTISCCFCAKVLTFFWEQYFVLEFKFYVEKTIMTLRAFDGAITEDECTKGVDPEQKVMLNI